MVPTLCQNNFDLICSDLSRYSIWFRSHDEMTFMQSTNAMCAKHGKYKAQIKAKFNYTDSNTSSDFAAIMKSFLCSPPILCVHH